MATPDGMCNTIKVCDFAREATTKYCYWFLTLHKYVWQDLYDLINLCGNHQKKTGVKSVVFQTEIGEKTEGHHLHAMITYYNASSFKTMKKKYPRAHLERVRYPKLCFKYCTKPETWTGIRYFKEYGKVIILENNFSDKAIPDWSRCVAVPPQKEKKEDYKKWRKEFLWKYCFSPEAQSKTFDYFKKTLTENREWETKVNEAKGSMPTYIT